MPKIIPTATVLTMFSALALLVVAEATSAQEAVPNGPVATDAHTSADRGRAIYSSIGCSHCHGHFGQGGPGRKLAPYPLPLTLFSNYVRHPTGDMPPYASAILSEAQMADIHAYLSSIPVGPSANEIPLLNPPNQAGR